MADPFASRLAGVRRDRGPLVWGLDPASSLLESWGLGDTADGLEHFVDIVVEAAVGTVGLVKPQSAFYERHGWRGIRALGRLISEARSAGVLVVLDAKRGDVGSTNDAYAEAYLGPGAPLEVDALTVHPYLGLGAMDAFVTRAEESGACLLVVTRSSNPDGRAIQTAHDDTGRSVEQALLAEIGALNATLAPGAIGPVGAVVGPTHLDPALDLAGTRRPVPRPRGRGPRGDARRCGSGVRIVPRPRHAERVPVAAPGRSRPGETARHRRCARHRVSSHPARLGPCGDAAACQ